MRRIVVIMLVAAVTFSIGVSSAYVGWLLYRSADIPPVTITQSEIESMAVSPARDGSPVAEDIQKSLEEEWRNLTTNSLCTGGVYYDPERENESAGFREIPLFNPYGLLPSIRKNRHTAIEFLLARIPDRARTNAHVCPQEVMIKGELAVYCLQHILKVNWYDLKTEYGIRYHRMFDKDVMESQALLRKIIKTRSGGREMQMLWAKYYESHASEMRDEK